MSSERRTINGKPISDVLTNLKQPFPYLVQDMAGNPALDEEQVYNRLDSVCGLNWSFVLTMQPKIEKLCEKKHTVVCAGFIEIRDDDGQLVCRRGQTGGADVIIPKTEPKDLSSDFKSAVTDCFKKCAKTFGLRPVLAPGGKTYKNSDEAAKEGYNASTTNTPDATGKVQSNSSAKDAPAAAGKETPAENPQQAKTADGAVRYKVTRKGVKDNKKLKLDVVDENGTTGQLVFWNNVQAKIEPELMQKINNAEPGLVLTVTCNEGQAYKNVRQFYVESVLKIA